MVLCGQHWALRCRPALGTQMPLSTGHSDAAQNISSWYLGVGIDTAMGLSSQLRLLCLSEKWCGDLWPEESSLYLLGVCSATCSSLLDHRVASQLCTDPPVQARLPLQLATPRAVSRLSSLSPDGTVHQAQEAHISHCWEPRPGLHTVLPLTYRGSTLALLLT